MIVADVADMMEQIAPPALSEPWDNTGLLLGDRRANVDRIMTCLTLTDETVDEAIHERADLVISHHPLPFKPLAKITTGTQVGKLLWKLASARISVYSPHTAWDSATDGINAQLARKLSLQEVEPLIPSDHHELGAGRFGSLKREQDVTSLARKLVTAVPYCRPRAVAPPGSIQRVALGCGSGGSFVEVAAKRGCQLLVTGEATFHTCLEAQSLGIGLLMIGHFASEKFAMDQLAGRLATVLEGISVWGSRRERDPVQSIELPPSDL